MKKQFHLQRYHIFMFFILVAFESMAANFAHPITPTLIQNLKLPDYSFGLLYAGMAFTNFLFSPLWAKQVSLSGSKRVLGICCIGYGIGQALFGFGTKLPFIMFARLLSGFFVGGIMVSFLTYIIHHTSIENRGSYLALSATLTTVFAAFGYLVGGMIGVFSIPVTFALQSFTLIGCGILFPLVLQQDQNMQQHESLRIRDVNPFQAFYEVRNILNASLCLLFVVVLITSAATTAYDQNFNYFIKDQLGFPSSYNGLIKAVVGFISLFANATVCLWIIRHTNVKKSLIYILFSAGCCLIIMTFMNDMMGFILVNFLFFALNAIYIPLLQDVCASQKNTCHSNQIMGLYNAMKSLGMIVGALFAGFIYAFGARLSFFYAGIFFLLGALGMNIFLLLCKKSTIK